MSSIDSQELDQFDELSLRKPAKRGDSIKPGVERRKTRKEERARETGGSNFINRGCKFCAVAHFAGLFF